MNMSAMPYSVKRHVSKVMHAKQEKYYHDLFNNISIDTKRTICRASKLLFRKKTLLLPDGKDHKTTLERFNTYFITKVEKIMKGLVPTKAYLID